MGFISYIDGNTIAGSTASYNDSRYVMISHAAYPHGLILSEFDADGYKSTLQKFTKSEGVSLVNNLIVGGQKGTKNRWEIQKCIVKELQLDCFNALLDVYQTNGAPLTFTDAFTQYQYISGSNQLPTWYGATVTNTLGHTKGFTSWNAHIDVDTNYSTWIGNNRWVLQFSVLQI